MTAFQSPSNDVNKIDLVPTLSLLMGIPIPFSNVGKVMSSLFEYSVDCQHVRRSPEFSCHEDIAEIQWLWNSISALRINVAQIQRYVASIVPNVIQRQLEELLERHDRSWVLLNYIPSDDKLATIQSLTELRNKYDDYISQLKTQLSLNLASFDSRLMISGLIVIMMGAITANLIRVLDFPFHENSFNDILFLSAVTSIVVPIGGHKEL
ncbi:unnamed protein product [Oppiella nova]|uniref:Uncharacterized protein n=1 Tax=Oppiella nova TaxID=334625 RepID=A0A7R9MBL1_9ACAR|nr:unnamed protein product [Oppiella nova]CAG2173288.1 unnamed protein product [Oppiella nova]